VALTSYLYHCIAPEGTTPFNTKRYRHITLQHQFKSHIMYHHYFLEPYKGPGTRYTCPACNKHKTFTRYIDAQTGKHLNNNVGCCDRAVKCGHHYKPKQYFEDNPGTGKTYQPVFNKQKVEPVSYLDMQLLTGSLQNYNQNNFILFLKNVFGAQLTQQLAGRYMVGTSNHWPGATVFWQVDTRGNIRTGKIMLYSPDTGKRVKQPYNHIAWAHTALNKPTFNLKQCFFGEHLLKHETKPVAIVESEKTAIIASAYLPEYTWLATGSLSNLTEEKCRALKGRRVMLYPDLNAFDKWKQKAKELEHLARFGVLDWLQQHATETDKQNGLDLADYLLRHNYRKFTAPAAPVPVKPTQQQPTAFIGHSGRLYLPTPPNHRTYTAYPDITAYNTRSSLPDFISIETGNTDFKAFVVLNLKTLTITGVIEQSDTTPPAVYAGMFG
jgi:hypothetical protein